MTARFVSSVLRGRSSALVAVALVATAVTTAQAASIFTSNLSAVTDPGGLTVSTGHNFQLGIGSGPVGSDLGITNTLFSPGVLGYNFIFAQGFGSASAVITSAINTGATIGNAVVKLDAATTADPFSDPGDNGAFLALDSVYERAPIDITLPTISGQSYTLSFDYAGTQQAGYSGASTDFLHVCLDANCTVTPTVSLASQGFSGWFQFSETFTASGPTVLSFLADGTPTGVNQQPAFTLLDNVSVTTLSTPPPSIPEPNSLLLLSTGLVGLGGFIRARYHKS